MNIYIVAYCIINLIIIFLCSKLSYKLNLLDIPNKRKMHDFPTAYTGGIAISLCLLFGVIIFDTFNPSISSILSIGFLISIVGLIDDKYNLNTGGKLSLQILPIFYLIIFENFKLKGLGDYTYFSLELGVFTIPFTLLSVLLLINSFNYFDGVDGLLSFTTISVMCILFFLITENSNHFLLVEQNIQFFLIILIIPIGIFILFNFSFFKIPKLFLGDSGSLFLGFVISFLLIYFANQNLVHPILLAWSVVIFVYEFISINLIRIINKQKIFNAGKDHLHHIIFLKTNSIFLTNLFVSGLNFCLFIVGYLSYFYINPLSSLILYIFCFLFFFLIRNSFQIKNFN